ncbi:hypothetical protein [Afifella pfennigii]|uniref:hypothetical protein n=1 Tax=Afifella pfennigii TaxID=209897 RepID=UPI00047884AF|nr:hypothetical protein [Afifella pfennigii]
MVSELRSFFSRHGLFFAVAVALTAAAIFSPFYAVHAADGGVTTIATAAGTSVDFGPLASVTIEYLAPIVVTVLGTLATWVLGRIGTRTGLAIDAGHREAIEQALGRAVGYAATQLENRAAGGIPINLKSRALTTATNYALAAVPDALKHFGITAARLSEMVEARLSGMLVDPENPPQTLAARIT